MGACKLRLRSSWCDRGPSWGCLRPSWAVLGHLVAVLEPSWGRQGAILGPLGSNNSQKAMFFVRFLHIFASKRSATLLPHPGPPWDRLGAFLGCLRAVSGPSSDRLGTVWACLEAVLGRLGPSWGVLGPSWAVLGPSWGHLGAVLGYLGTKMRFLKDIPHVLGDPAEP